MGPWDEGEIERHAEAFDALSDPTRLAIALEMFARQFDEGPQSYAAVMDAVGIEDSGRFNYHLEKLQPEFVTTEDGEYVATDVVREIAMLVTGGHVTDDAMVGPRPVGGACLQCGTPLGARHDHLFAVVCPACENGVLYGRVAPTVARERDLRTLARETDRKISEETTTLLRSHCTRCGGRTGSSYLSTEGSPYLHGDVPVFVAVGCARCWNVLTIRSVGHFLLAHPEVRAYAREHDIDLEERPSWEYQWTRDGFSTTVRSRDHWEIEQVAFVDGCRLVVVFGEGGSVETIDHLPIRPERLPNVDP